MTSQAIYGSALRLLQLHEDWVQVETLDAYTGWALLDELIRLQSPDPVRVWARVAGLSANVYAEPNVKLRMPLINLPFEARLQVTQQQVPDHPAWSQVRLLDGQLAYVQRGDLDQEPELVGVQAMLAFAQRFLGITYTWGGVSSFGFDCSGFVQMLFRQCGVTTPRDAQQQADWGSATAIAQEQLAAGDVVFFGESPRAITHVGIMLDAAMLLHATTEGRPGVQISRLADEPWRTRLCAQRRFPLPDAASSEAAL